MAEKIQNISRTVIRKRLVWVLLYILSLNFLFFSSFGSLAAAWVLVSGFILVWGLFSSFKNIITRPLPALALGTTAVLSALNIIRTDNIFLQLISCFLGLFTLILASVSWIRGQSFIASLAEAVLAFPYLLFNYLNSGWNSLKNIRSGNFVRLFRPDSSGSGFYAASIFRGILISLPLLAIFLYLFTGADPVFKTFSGHYLSIDFIQRLPARLIISLLLFTFFLPVCFIRLPQRFVSPLHYLLNRWKPVIEAAVVQTIIGALFSIFLAVQWPYVFASVAAETDLSRFGVATYSEYVRQGFGELLFASLLVYCLVWLGLIILRASPQAKYLKFIQLLNLAVLGLFLVSIARRLWLYQYFHGLSLVRIYGGLLLLWLAGMFLFLVARHFRAYRWVVAESFFTAVLILAAVMSNPEHFLAVYHPPTVNRRVDYVYLSALSADGFSGWSRALDYAQNTLDSVTASGAFIDQNGRRQLAYSGWIVQNLMAKYSRLVVKYGTPGDIAGFKNQIQKFAQNSTDARASLRPRAPGSFSRWQWANVFTLHQPQTWRLFYTESSSPGKDLTSQERFYSFNASEARAFSLMSSGNWLQKLLDLQAKFQSVYLQVISQAESQRGYVLDISPGLFLEW